MVQCPASKNLNVIAEKNWESRDGYVDDLGNAEQYGSS